MIGEWNFNYNTFSDKLPCDWSLPSEWMGIQVHTLDTILSGTIAIKSGDSVATIKGIKD